MLLSELLTPQRVRVPIAFDALDGPIEALGRLSHLVQHETTRERLVRSCNAGEFLRLVRESEGH